MEKTDLLKRPVGQLVIDLYTPLQLLNAKQKNHRRELRHHVQGLYLLGFNIKFQRFIQFSDTLHVYMYRDKMESRSGRI